MRAEVKFHIKIFPLVFYIDIEGQTDIRSGRQEWCI